MLIKSKPDLFLSPVFLLNQVYSLGAELTKRNRPAVSCGATC